MTINYTPFAHLTDKELIVEVCAKHDPTDLEMELMMRLEVAHDTLEDHNLLPREPKAKYK